MKFGIPQDAFDKILAAIKSYPEIRQAIIYGSRAKGNYKKGSDIDICLIADSFSMHKLLKLENELDDLYLPWDIDICLKDKITEIKLLEHINRVGIPII